MDDQRQVEKLRALRAGETGEVAPPQSRGPTPVRGPSRAAARAETGRGSESTVVPPHDLDRMAEWHDPETARFLQNAADLRSARAGRGPSLLSTVFGTGPLPGVPQSWLLAGDLLAVGSLIAGCTLTAMALGPVGVLATVAMEAMAYAGGVVITQAGHETLEKAQRTALLLSSQDPRTGLPDQATTLELLSEEFQTSRKSRSPLAVLLIEVDQFADEGALPPDTTVEEVLRHVASLVRTALREEDGLGLHGRVRLMAVVPGFPAAPAALVAERIRLAVASVPIHLDGLDFPLTVSLGVATTDLAPLAELPGLLKRAAQALYRARTRGRNRVVVAGFR